MYQQKLLRDIFRNRRKNYENLVPSGTRERQIKWETSSQHRVVIKGVVEGKGYPKTQFEEKRNKDEFRVFIGSDKSSHFYPEVNKILESLKK